jgi:hypothetical protein
MALSKKLEAVNTLYQVRTDSFMEDSEEKAQFIEVLEKVVKTTSETIIPLEKLGDNLYSYYDKTLLNSQFIVDLKELAKTVDRNIFLLDWFNNEVDRNIDLEKGTWRDNKEPFFIVLPNPKFLAVKNSETDEDGIVDFDIRKAFTSITSVALTDTATMNNLEGVNFSRIMSEFVDGNDRLELGASEFYGQIIGQDYGHVVTMNWTHRACWVNFATFIKGFSIPLPEDDYPSRLLPECILTPSVAYNRHATQYTFGKLFKFLKELPTPEEREVVKLSKRYVVYMSDFFERLKRTNKDRLRLVLQDISTLRQSVFNKEKEAREIETLNKSLAIKIGKQMTRDLDEAKVSREFKYFSQKFKRIDLDQPDRIIGYTKLVEIQANTLDGVRKIFTLGEYKIDILFSGNVLITNLTNRVECYDHPHINDKIPCLGTIARMLPTLILDGGFLTALDMMHGFLCSYANGEGFQPFKTIDYWPSRAIPVANRPTVLQEHDPMREDNTMEQILARQRADEANRELNEFENHPVVNEEEDR